MTVEAMWELLTTYEVVTEETLQVVTDINGYSCETLQDVLYSRTGYRDFSNWLESEE